MIKTIPLTKENIKTIALPGLERNLFSSAAWLSVLCQTYKLSLFAKYIEENDQIKSYIIYSIVDNFLEQKICICSYCDYFDCHVQTPEHWQMFFDSLRKEYPRYRIAIRNLRDQLARENPNFALLSKERFHILDINDDLDSIWKKTHDSFRSAVKQAQKNGIEVKRGARADLDKFYKLHLRLRKSKYRLFPQPFRFFDKIWREYMESGNGFLLGAYNRDGKFVGGNVFLRCGDTLYYKFNTSDLNFVKLRVNNLLLWEGIKLAKELNLKFLDLGSSGYEQHGLIMFKDHVGAKCLDICHLGFNPPDYKFSQKRILKVFTHTLTAPWVPDFITRAGSSIIYPFLA
ncbi:MAG: GNAT family N-acetyltransferase [Candidatus Omnitrophota bacterium]